MDFCKLLAPPGILSLSTISTILVMPGCDITLLHSLRNLLSWESVLKDDICGWWPKFIKCKESCKFLSCSFWDALSVFQRTALLNLCRVHQWSDEVRCTNIIQTHHLTLKTNSILPLTVKNGRQQEWPLSGETTLLGHQMWISSTQAYMWWPQI